MTDPVSALAERLTKFLPGADCTVIAIDILTFARAKLPTQEEIARILHVAYESAALLLGWRTQESCRVEFDALPKATMLVAAAILRDLTTRLGGQEATR